MLLYERDTPTVSLLRWWSVEHSDVEIEIASGDWRTRFDRALAKQDGLVFITFDSYRFNRHQLSTHDTNDGNSQGRIAECIRSTLEASGFEELAIVKPSASMMSLLYQRRVDFSAQLTSLPSRLRTWFGAIEHRC